MKTVMQAGEKVSYKKDLGRTYFFQQWGVDVVETNTDLGTFSIAIIMDLDGNIKTVYPEHICRVEV